MPNSNTRFEVRGGNVICGAFSLAMQRCHHAWGHRQERSLLQLSHPVTKIVPSQESARETRSSQLQFSLSSVANWLRIWRKRLRRITLCLGLTEDDVDEFRFLCHHFCPRICEAHVFQPLPLEGCRIARGPRGRPRHHPSILRPIVAGLCLAAVCSSIVGETFMSGIYLDT